MDCMPDGHLACANFLINLVEQVSVPLDVHLLRIRIQEDAPTTALFVAKSSGLQFERVKGTWLVLAHELEEVILGAGELLRPMTRYI